MKMLARHLLLAALLLRALAPIGWMPGTAQLGQAAWIICTADGQIQHGAPGKDDDAHQHQPCAFAAAHVMASSAAQALPAPLLHVGIIDRTIAPASAQSAARFAPQSPRAPPVSA